jgi:hypothetical protein
MLRHILAAQMRHDFRAYLFFLQRCEVFFVLVFFLPVVVPSHMRHCHIANLHNCPFLPLASRTTHTPHAASAAAPVGCTSWTLTKRRWNTACHGRLLAHRRQSASQNPFFQRHPRVGTCIRHGFALVVRMIR